MTAPRLAQHPNLVRIFIIRAIPWTILAAFALVAVGVAIGGLLL